LPLDDGWPELSETQQRDIIRAVTEGGIRVWQEQAEKYARYGMTVAAVDALCRGKRWRHKRRPFAPSTQLEMFNG
jgi:Xaa-Pro aminopeptidase